MVLLPPVAAAPAAAVAAIQPATAAAVAVAAVAAAAKAWAGAEGRICVLLSPPPAAGRPGGPLGAFEAKPSFKVLLTGPL